MSVLPERDAVPTLHGAYNFRDLGDLPTESGGRTVPGVLFRSDALDQLTEEDVRVLVDVIGVRSVIDLRASVETEGRRPQWARTTTIDFVNLPLSDDWSDYGELDDEGRRTLMARKYMSYLDSASTNVVAILERLAADRDVRPAVIHCAVGKDRTGAVVAVLLRLLGVTREAVVADYLRTADHLDRILDRLRRNETYRARMETNPPEVYEAAEHTMQLFLDELEQRAGGAERWALDHGVGESTIRRLREMLVMDEPTPDATTTVATAHDGGDDAGALSGRTIVTGVVGDDIHVIGIRLVEHALRGAGATVVSLGVMTPLVEFVEAAVETAADAVVISSSNGHAAISCEGAGDMFTEAGLDDLPLYIGGNLRVGSRAGTQEEIEAQFRGMGFTRVFAPNADLADAVQTIAVDLSARNPRR
jgi:methylaspartate mutase S subunit